MIVVRNVQKRAVAGIAHSRIPVHFFFGGAVGAFTNLATRNVTAFFAGILIAAPVVGFRPTLDFTTSRARAQGGRRRVTRIRRFRATAQPGKTGPWRLFLIRRASWLPWQQTGSLWRSSLNRASSEPQISMDSDERCATRWRGSPRSWPPLPPGPAAGGGALEESAAAGAAQPRPRSTITSPRASTYYSDGLTDEVIQNLPAIEGLEVRRHRGGRDGQRPQAQAMPAFRG